MLSLLHVSDVHFGPKHLPELSRAVLELARRASPAALVVSGDLTQRAKPHQFREARAWIDQFPCPVAFVPGNHDVPMYRFWERLFAPFGAWRKHFDRALVREVSAPGIELFGLDTAFAWTTKHGRVEPKELESLSMRLAGAPPGAVRALVAHHPLAGAPELGHEPVSRRGSSAIELCRRSGVELVLSGHLHHGFWFRSAGGERGRPGPLVVHCGTTSSSRGRGIERGRSSLVWIEVEADAIRLERRFWTAGAEEFRTEAAEEFARLAPDRAGARVP